MKLLKLSFVVPFLVLVTFYARGQKVSKELLIRYPASVTTRVYDIVKKVPLDNVKQGKLAVIFQREDSLVNIAIAANAEMSEISDIHLKAEIAMNSLLTSAELDQLYTSIARVSARSQAKESVKKLKLSNTDTAISHLFYDIYFAKYLEIGKLQQMQKYDTSLSVRIEKAAAYHDSILNRALVYEGINTPNSVFFVAVKNRKSLGLTNKQTDSLITKGYQLESLYKAKRHNKKIIINPASFEQTNLQSILTKEQQGRAQLLFNKEEANAEALQYWGELKQHNLIVKSDSTTTISQMEHYLLRYKTIVLSYANNPVAQTQRLTALADSMPRPLRELLVMERTDTSNKTVNVFFDVLRKKEILKLSTLQIDSLTKKGFEMEKKQASRKKAWFDIGKYEHQNLATILSSKQYSQYLFIADAETANKEASINWNEIKRRNLGGHSDSTKVIAALSHYLLAKRVITNVYQDSTAIKHASLQSLNDTIPLLMLRLFAAQRTDSTNKDRSLFVDALTRKNQLKLTALQTDTLAKKELYLTTNYGGHLIASRYYEARKYERLNIENILTEEQLSKFYAFRNTMAATKEAMKNWDELKKFKLVQPADSLFIMQQITIYQLAQFVAKDRYVYSRTLQQENLKAINDAMPEPMQQLRIAKLTNADSTNVSKHYRGTFQW